MTMEDLIPKSKTPGEKVLDDIEKEVKKSSRVKRDAAIKEKIFNKADIKVLTPEEAKETLEEIKSQNKDDEDAEEEKAEETEEEKTESKRKIAYALMRQGNSHEQIAESMGISLDEVKVIFRGKQA
jgi:DNA-binding NarL/FixJ family response regulator